MTDIEYAAPWPDTIVLIHGLWMTSLCWEHWVRRYSNRGFYVVARSWPGMDRDVQELRHDPSGIAGLGLGEIVEHYERVVQGLDSAPIIMGHGFGGLITQILLDRGFGSAGVAIDSAPVKGLLLMPLSPLPRGSSTLRDPANSPQAEGLTAEQFHRAFGNNISEEESQMAYERYTVPGPDLMLFQAAFAAFNPHSPTAVHLHNGDRAPLLLIAGGKDLLAPASVTEANFRLYRKCKAITEYKAYPERSHYTFGEPGWEEVADQALDWAVMHSTAPDTDFGQVH